MTRLVWTLVAVPLVAAVLWGIAYPFRKLCERLPEGRVKRALLWMPQERRRYRGRE